MPGVMSCTSAVAASIQAWSADDVWGAMAALILRGAAKSLRKKLAVKAGDVRARGARAPQRTAARLDKQKEPRGPRANARMRGGLIQ